ncbi:hypothetical protein MMC29_004489 [Sticta canariensis]|nr:hypothetical protein [Sticta canariensis]
MATGQAIVTKALQNLKSSITPEDARTFKDTTLEDLWRDAREIEREQGKRLALQHMDRLEQILRSLESYSSAIDTICQGFSPMAWVWGPIKMMLMLARQHATVMDKILQAFGDIAAVLPRIDILKETFGDSVAFQLVLSHIYSDILEFHQRVYKFFRRKSWHFWFAFDWGLFERRFKSILEKLSAHCNVLDKEAAAIHFSEMKKMRDSHQREDEEFEERRHAQMFPEVLGWLSAAEDSQEEYLHTLAEKRQLETCDWILKDDQMFSWIENEMGDSILWMTGIPGAGKSILSSLIIENLRIRNDRITLYYFCGQSSAKDSCGIVLRTLANQLVRENRDLAPLIHQCYLQKGSTTSHPAMKKMLKDVLSTVKPTRIVLDGVDECDYRVQKDVLSSLIELQKHAGENLKILVSSRETPEIKTVMPQKMHMRLDGKTNDALHLYIQQRVKLLKENFPDYDPILFQRVEQRLREKADGMFLWVYLVSTMLEKKAPEIRFKNAIELLPDGLEAAYGLVLDRFRDLESDLKERCFKILFWVCTAYRPISIHEVVDGVALEPGQMTLSRKTRIQNLNRDILDICAPIIEEPKSGILGLVHFSAKEYLLDRQSGPFVEVAQAHFSIAFSCIANLTSALSLAPRYSHGMTDADLETIVVQGGYGLEQYGQQYWAQHVRDYFQNISRLDDQSRGLINALDVFSKVRKHSSAFTGTSSELKKLAPYPLLRGFTAGWLRFRSELDEKGPLFESIEAQEDWRLLNDETFLSLIDSRLRSITERLLMMDPSNLPSHIREDDFKAFVNRFGFSCRFHNCTHHFGSRQDRDAHEVTHSPSFPCLECDFSQRGFRSRKDLDKHVRQYHKSMEDFEIPNSLLAADSFSNQNFTPPGRSSRCWNDQGRKVLQLGFGKVLDRLKSEITSADDENNQTSSSTQDPNEQTNRSLGELHRLENVSIGLENIQEKIKEQRYQSLAEFKDDIRQISNDPDLCGNPCKLKGMETICDQELEKIFASFPVFANLSPEFPSTSKDFQNPLHGMESLGMFAESLESSGFCSKRKPYWSSVEEGVFPNLIQRYGRDYAKISDYLKTKTAGDVEQHFLYLVSIGREDLSGLADAADIKLRLQFSLPEPIQGSESSPLALPSINAPVHDITQTPSSYDLPPDLSTGARDKDSALMADSLGSEAAASHGDRNNERKKYTRSLPPRAMCNRCTDIFPKGLRDEHTLKKHNRSIHTATRKRWICVDISIDKMFLTKCKKCVSDKRYRSKLYAAKHLRRDHFSEQTGMETLSRWMEEIEEPNPNYDKRRTNASTDSADLPRIWEAIKLPKTNKTSISRFSQDRLPALQNTLDRGSHSSRSPSPVNTSESDGASHDENPTNESGLNANALNDDMYFHEISFNHLLPSVTTPSAHVSGVLETDQVTRALIQPDQVPRLPHLNPFQMAACQDQVDALHEKLKSESTHKDALDSLTHLTRTLRQNLVDWRRHSSGAPTIPFKI